MHAIKSFLLLIILVLSCAHFTEPQPVEHTITIEIVQAYGCVFYPVLWIWPGDATFPTPFRMYDMNCDYHGPAVIKTYEDRLISRLAYKVDGVKGVVRDTLIICSVDTVWVVGTIGAFKKGGVCNGR